MEQMKIWQVGHLPESVCFVGCGTKFLSSNHIRKPKSNFINLHMISNMNTEHHITALDPRTTLHRRVRFIIVL